MTSSGLAMHEKARECQDAIYNKTKVEMYEKHAVPSLEAQNRELRQWIAASIGQFRYAQWLLTEPVHSRSQQIDEFIQKLEGALK